MANLPNIKDLIQIRLRTLDKEFTLPVEESVELLKKTYNKFNVSDKWIERDVNIPDPGDIWPGFIKGAFEQFLIKMGWEVDNVGELKISKQDQINDKTYAVFVFFEGRDKNHMKEKATRQEATKVRIKKRREKEKRKKKVNKRK